MPEHGAPGGTLAANRILLPGESLSKYGGTTAETRSESNSGAAVQTAAVKTNYVAPKPSTLIEAPLEWDGGLLMPGESLSRYRGKSETKAAEPAVEVAEPESAVMESHVHEASPANVAEVQLVAELPEEAPTSLVEPVQEFTDVEATRPDVIAMPELPSPVHAEPERVEVTAHEPVAPAEVGEEEIGEEEIHEEVQEFEPESASASHKVDPAAPSEFRVSSVAEEESSLADTDLAVVAQEIREDSPIEAHSAAGTIDYVEEEHDAQATEVADQLFGFAPGSGVLEEEVIDEEEYDFEPIHRHADEHDSEDLEEETLDHAGELGEMVRDSHLDQRVSSGRVSRRVRKKISKLVKKTATRTKTRKKQKRASKLKSVEHGSQPAAVQPTRPRRDGDRGERGRGRRGDRRGDRRGGHPGARRHSAQTMDLPIISDLLKQGQEILVQIAKEPIAKKGARITSHIALPGRFLVFMPTVNHVGVSRKISSDEERQRLKRILISERGEASGGFIVRTAADGASEDELRADLRFLISLWNDIKQREEASKAPALIYHDLNLVERVLRDQVSDNFSAIWVDNEMEYERTVRFLNRFQPSLVRRVKLYTKETPLFEQFGIQDEITKALKSKVWLKSGGSIVINQTEALVAIDINTGKYVGKTARLEDTILKTNLDAIPEIVRQIRLRDLGGIIVIDFIDMDERKNRHKVMAALEEALKADRAPSKVLQFNDFGLVAITRKRVKQSLERTLSTPARFARERGW